MLSKTIITMVVTKHNPLQFCITVNHPTFDADEKIGTYLKSKQISFKRQDYDTLGSPQQTKIVVFKVNKTKSEYIDEVIAVLYQQTSEVYVLDTFFNKKISAMQLPTGRMIAIVKK